MALEIPWWFETQIFWHRVIKIFLVQMVLDRRRWEVTSSFWCASHSWFIDLWALAFRTKDLWDLSLKNSKSLKRMGNWLKQRLTSIQMRLQRWKNNSSWFPILSLVARDMLAIFASTVASKKAFSTGGRVFDTFRSSLSPKMVRFQKKHLALEVECLILFEVH